MSLTIEQVLDDARRLVDRLRDHDNAADSLIEQSTTLNKRIEAMKQYQEEVEEMNNVARHRPRAALILGIQQENRQIRDLQRENRELKVALEEHQSALDLIMSSYREQVCRMLIANRIDRDCIEKHSEFQENSMASAAKIIEMAAVMKQAIELDEKTSCDVEQQLTRLQVENRGLRELLEISRTFHHHHHAASQDEKKDKEKDPVLGQIVKEVTKNVTNTSDNKLVVLLDTKPASTEKSTGVEELSGTTESGDSAVKDGKVTDEASKAQTADEETMNSQDDSEKQDSETSVDGQDVQIGLDLEAEAVMSDFDIMTAGLEEELGMDSDA